LVLPGDFVVWNAAAEVLVPKNRPEILAPAGDHDALAAALAAGADAVYLGLDDGFNARARAANFPSDRLAEIAAWVHRAGAKLYVAINTLVFEPELPIVGELIARVAAAGADAVIVQDPAVVMLARAAGLEVHASTQMTASSPLAIELLKELGIARVVVPRELSVDEIRAYKAGTDVELEVFVHGALCVAWSGQCLSSEAWGGRSANRGQCAQACRLPYELIVDGQPRDLGDVAYLLSPHDLVGLDRVSELADAGVTSLKIEGRLKGPAYVATATAQYRKAVDPAFETTMPLDRAALEVAYSRGASQGFLGGTDHQTLVEGRFPRHRGLLLGRVVRVEGDELDVELDPAYRHAATRTEPVAGMGVVFDAGTPEAPEQGGPIFSVSPLATRSQSTAAGRSPLAAARTPTGHRLRFGDPGPDLSRVHAGDRVWINSDPRVTAAGARAAQLGRSALGRIALALEVSGGDGEPLVATARAAGHVATARTSSPLAPARGAGITRELLADKLGSLGGTPFHLGELTLALAPGLHVPVSELKELRRALVAELDAHFDRPRAIVAGAPRELPEIAPLLDAPIVVPLCRNDDQLDAVLDAGAREVELDWMELVGLGRAVERAKARGARVIVATVRVQKPNEERIDAHLARLEPDGILVRSWGSLAYLRQHAIPLHGDFSLNVANSTTARWVLGKGLVTVAAAHDLDRVQLAAMLAATPRGRVSVAIHHHIPTFHTEHCVYAHLLSSGRDFRTCGRPCERHAIALRDRVGLVHPVSVDVGCRNTVFNAQAQSAAALVPELRAAGVARFRVELVRESAAEAKRLYDAYSQLVAGTIAPAEVVAIAAAHEQFGVTRGTMRTLTVLR
jgi:putative protease